MSSPTHRLRLAVAAIAWLPLVGGAAACAEEEVAALVAALGEGCLLDSDCADALVCVFRRCHVQCETTKDCVARGTGTDCVLGDRSKVCLLPTEERCTVDEESTSGGVVVPVYLHVTCPDEALLCARDGSCRNRCSDADDCVAGATCTVTGVCAHEDDASDAGNPINEEGEAGVVSATCIYSSECIAPLTCRDNQCRPSCLGDADCAAGQRCVPVESPSLGESYGACRYPGVDPSLDPSCQNGALDAGESDVDCGGASCLPCGSGSSCAAATDCASGICTGAICQVPSCDDGVVNANETDVDCGGPQCAPCDAGGACLAERDCGNALRCDTTTFTCVAATCGDGLRNGDESDVDCGGGCPATCPDGSLCVGGADCGSGVCVAGACLAPTCSDGVENGAEASVDCGAPASGCAPCGNGASCTSGADCQSGSCATNACAAPSCTDGVQNGFEHGIDCGGPDCALLGRGCALGSTCDVDDDCDQATPAGCSPTTTQCVARHTITVSRAGLGDGYVASSPAGLSCHGGANAVCALTLFAGESVTLTGYPAVGSTFGGFAGACTGNPSCTIAVSNADVAVTASFD